MKNRILWLSVIITLSVLLGCRDDDDPVTPQTQAISEDEAANLIAASLGGKSSTNGMTAQIEQAATVAGGGSLLKYSDFTKTAYDTTVFVADTIGNFSYDYRLHYTVDFTNGGNQLNFLFDMKGRYDTPYISSDDSANASITVFHVVDLDTQYTINETYTRLGTQTSKVGNRLSFSSVLNIVLSDLKVGKSSKQINSGSAAITVSGQTNDGRSFSYYALVVFQGNQQASLTINAISYTINLSTGRATRA